MIVAIDLGGTRTKFGLVNHGEVKQSSNCPADPQGFVERHLNYTLEQIRDLCSREDTTLEQCQGIGLLCTGLVNNRDMCVISTNAKYDDAIGFDFRGWAQDRTGLELRMDNDARGALLGEWRFGAGRGVDNLVMVTIGTGIGTAVILDGKPLVGPHFSSGILGGHLLVHSGGRKCTCGAVGCLESEASGWVLPVLLQEHPQYLTSSLNGIDKPGFRELMKHAAEGDACAQAVQAHCLQMWGEALVSFIHLFDPERIIIGGGIMNEPETVLAGLRKTVAELAWAETCQVEIIQAGNPDNAGLIGAAALFYTMDEPATDN